MPVNKFLEGKSPPAWTFGPDDGDIVIKSSIYLARNFKDFRFPHIASDDELKEVANIIREVLKKLPLEEIHMERLTDVERKILCDKRYLAQCFLKEKKFRSLYIKKDGKEIVAANEEDHVLITCKKEGLGFSGLLEKAFEYDDLLEEAADFAYDETYGYLTALPARVGTGLRGAVLLHLPALSYTKNIKNTTDVANRLGMNLIPLYGQKEKEWQGNLFFLSNNQTIGLPEKDMIKRVENFAKEIAASERKGRDALIKYRKDALSDIIWRAYGLLEHSKMLTEKEALDAASKLQLGSDLGLIKKLPANFFGEIFTLTRTSYLRNIDDDVKNVERLRAIIANKRLQGVK